MQSEISTADAPLVSRRDVAAAVKDRASIGAFGFVMDDLRRAILTPTQRSVMELIVEDSLQRGFWSVCYARLEDLVFDMAGEPPRVNLSANDLSPTLKRLHAMHLIRAEFGARAGWYVLVLPSSGWNVQWHRPASRRALRWMHLDGLRRAAAPFLPSFAPDADLYDALARAVPGASSAAENAGEEKILASRQDFSSAQKADAPDVQPMAGRGACASRHSESRNADLRGNARAIPKVGTPCARVELDRKLDSKIGHKTGQNNPIGMDSLKREELKSKLPGDQREFCYVARIIIGNDAWSQPSNGYAANAIKWTLRWKAGGEHRRKAVAVFAEILSADFQIRTTPAQAAQELWNQFGGAALDAARFAASPKKLKESFNQPIEST